MPILQQGAGARRLEGGYLNQHTFVRGRPGNDDHIASVALNLSL
jgi:hypothetical protein